MKPDISANSPSTLTTRREQGVPPIPPDTEVPPVSGVVGGDALRRQPSVPVGQDSGGVLQRLNMPPETSSLDPQRGGPVIDAHVSVSANVDGDEIPATPSTPRLKNAVPVNSGSELEGDTLATQTNTQAEHICTVPTGTPVLDKNAKHLPSTNSTIETKYPAQKENHKKRQTPSGGHSNDGRVRARLRKVDNDDKRERYGWLLKPVKCIKMVSETRYEWVFDNVEKGSWKNRRAGRIYDGGHLRRLLCSRVVKIGVVPSEGETFISLQWSCGVINRDEGLWEGVVGDRRVSVDDQAIISVLTGDRPTLFLAEDL